MITSVREGLPGGTVTFLFTDVEGSTRLLHELGAEAYAEALAEHRRVVREACAVEGGVEVDTQGDAFFFAFPTAPGALAAAGEMTDALASGQVQVRVGLHTGTPLLTEEGYVGGDVHRAARIAAAGHGGQVLVSSSTAQLVELELRDLGEYRFKDLGAPERIFQLGEGDFPALKSLYRTNLPVPATPFLGRERELAEVVELLTREDVRLLTLTGPGGTGKTRLALQAAAEASDSFPDGVFWVALAPLHDPGLVLSSVAQVLEVDEPAGELIDALAAQLAGKRLLLVLDNAEHLLPDLASTLAALAAACPTLRLLVTSRESLHVAVEIEHPVPTLEPADGVALFRQRAAAHGVDVAPSPRVEELCARLDELPLALELAAARTKLFSPEQLLERISQRLDLLKAGRDADPRQQTLRATIEWSHDLLSDEEQELFSRLSVFAGGCTYEAAEDVAGADADTLQSLLDKNLARRRDGDPAPRFWMLETIREYAVERLERGGEKEALSERHLDYFLALAERAYEERLAAASMWFPIVEAEHDNIRVALDWARVSDPQAEARLAGAIGFYWYLQGHARESRERLTGVLARYPSRDRIRARALTHLGDMPEDMEPGESLSYLDEALSLWREHGDVLGEALALEMIGYARIEAGEQQLARLAFELSLALRQQAGASELEGSRSLGGLCQMLVSSGEIECAEPMAQELYELGVRNDALRPQQSALHYLADCPLIGGDYAEAESRYVRAVAHARSSGILVMCATDLLGVAMSTAGQGDYARAVRLAAAAYAQLEAFGVMDQSPTHFWTKLQEWFIGGARAQLTPKELEAAERAGRAVCFDDILDEVLGTETAPVAS
jgi:predicted ATPase/class 3 adenylate cyclase